MSASGSTFNDSTITSSRTNSSTVNSSTVDPREVAHFEQLAGTWWDPEGPFWPLHTLNKLRIKWIVKQLDALGQCNSQNPLPLNGLKVLDVGCGGGILSESLAQLGAQVLGIDVVEKNIRIARAHAAQTGVNIDYQLSSVESLREQGKLFDVVFNMEVVEHVADLPTFMTHCNALVKPSGNTFISTINRNWLAWLVAIFGAEYVLRWLPKGTHHYNMLRKPSEIRQLLLNDQLAIRDTTGVAVNPFNKTMKITGMTWINYMLVATRN